MGQRIEVYMDSYSNTPIVQEVGPGFSIKIGDEMSRKDWERYIKEPADELALDVRVADIKHQFWDSEDCLHALSIRVVAV